MKKFTENNNSNKSNKELVQELIEKIGRDFQAEFDTYVKDFNEAKKDFAESKKIQLITSRAYDRKTRKTFWGID